MKRLAVLALAISLSACVPDYSTGFRVGVLQKFSYKGIFMRSHEGELILEGIKTRTVSNEHSTQTHITNTWSFSVVDQQVATELQNHFSAGSKIKLYYKQWLIKPLTIDTQYVVYKVEVSK